MKMPLKDAQKNEKLSLKDIEDFPVAAGCHGHIWVGENVSLQHLSKFHSFKAVKNNYFS